MLLRASNAVGYTNYPDNVVSEFVKAAAAHGIDVFRIFDSLNWTENMKVAMEAVREHTSAICEAAICYTGDILDPGATKYSLDYYVKMAKELVRMGTHVLGIKDMAGLCKPYAAHALVKALRDEVGVPIHFHTHDTSGINAASILRANDAGRGRRRRRPGVDERDDQPAQPQFDRGRAQNTPRDTRLDLDALNQLSDYWETVREYYYPFEEGLKSGTAEVYQHEMPGGQYTNLRQQAKGLGLEGRWHEIAETYAQVNQLFGDIVKVTPSSKVVGDLALFMVTNNLTADGRAVPGEKAEFPPQRGGDDAGDAGLSRGGWPKVFQRIVLDSAGAKPIKGRPGEDAEGRFQATRKELAAKCGRSRATLTCSRTCCIRRCSSITRSTWHYDNTSVIPTPPFFYGMQSGEEIAVEIEPGKTLIVRFLTTSEPREDGMRTIFFEFNGQPREVNVPDRSLEGHLHKHPKADAEDPDHVAAPMPGKISTVAVRRASGEGRRAAAVHRSDEDGDGGLFARKAKVKDVLVKPGSVVTAGDLLIVLEEQT